jgi:colanic acid/amylovoran biosynthesis glycosyltransferase
MTTPSILHCFDSYLPNTQNWAFRLIRNVPDCHHLVAAREFLDTPFYDSSIDYLKSRFPWGARLRKALSPVLQPAYRACIATRYRRGGVDIVHSHFGHAGWHYRRMAKQIGAKHVVSFYGWDYAHLPTIRPEWRGRWQTLFREADLFLCEGPHGATQLEAMGCTSDKIRVCRLGIEASSMVYARRRKVPGQLRLLQVAAFREKKGQLDAVRAFAKTAATCSGATLTFVGSGDPLLEQAVQDHAASHGVDDRVFFTPSIDFARLRDFMLDYHVFIHPSIHTRLNDCEGGAPIVLLDAQASGMPIVSTRHCDIPQEVVDGVTGILVEEGDTDGLAAAIERFYGMDQTEYDRFATDAHRHIAAEFDASECGRRLAMMYRSLLQQ